MLGNTVTVMIWGAVCKFPDSNCINSG